MTNELLFGILFLLIGLLIGGLLSWLIAKIRLQNHAVPRSDLKKHYVPTELHAQLQSQADILKEDLIEKQNENNTFNAELSAKKQYIGSLQEKLLLHKEEMNRLQENSKMEFENLANRILEEKTAKFTSLNQQQLSDILAPFKEKIKSFEEGIDRKFKEESYDRISLKKEIEQLRDLNMQLSQDATNLANALKGENKTQGDWGEFQLELLLQKAGLQKNIQYSVQESFKDEKGKHKRPDFIINLPDDKHLVIDAKVSLTAYEKYFNTEKQSARQKYLKAHVTSIRQHIKDLSSKNYQQLYDINTPDYVMLFIPLEPAFAVAVQEDNGIFIDALDKNIVIVTTSTLLATMRTVAFIWKQEKQKQNVVEIARQSGMLYDKFVNFVEDLKNVGQKLDNAQNAYHGAMNKLVDSKKFGDTLIGRAEKIKELGAKTSKQLPKDLLE